jgi:hypothetical protein
MTNKDIKRYRINLFDQMKRFFEIVDENPEFTQTEIALYFYLLNVNNRLTWREWFTLALSEALGGARLCEKTYYKGLNRLEYLHLIERRKGVKNKAGQIKIIELEGVNFTVNDTVNASVDDIVNASGNGNVKSQTFIDSKYYLDNEDKLEIKKRKNISVSGESETVVTIFRKTFENFYAKNIPGEHYYYTPEDERHAKQLVKKISSWLNGKTPPIKSTDENVINSFISLLDRLPEWFIENLSLRNINLKFNEIIANRTKSKPLQINTDEIKY